MRFQDYVIDSNWRLRSTVMTPMFVETQASQGPAGSLASLSLAGGAGGQLRATQATLEFTQTQAAGGKPNTPHDATRSAPVCQPVTAQKKQSGQ